MVQKKEVQILTYRIVFEKSSRAKLLHDMEFNVKVHSKDRVMLAISEDEFVRYWLFVVRKS